MNRTFFVLATAAALVIGSSSFAEKANDIVEQAPVTSVATVTGSFFGPALAQGAVPANAMAVTGEVVMWTPNELILHTAKGMEKFAITPQTTMIGGRAEGDEVTVIFTTPASARSAAVGAVQQVAPGRARAGTAATAGSR